MGTFFRQKMKKVDLEENKFNQKFEECSFFTSKDPITMSVVLMYKATKKVRTYFRE